MLTKINNSMNAEKTLQQIKDEEYNDTQIIYEQGWLSDRLPSEIAASNDKNRIERD